MLFSASFDSAVLYWTAIATATATAAFCVVILYFGPSSLTGSRDDKEERLCREASSLFTSRHNSGRHSGNSYATTDTDTDHSAIINRSWKVIRWWPIKYRHSWAVVELWKVYTNQSGQMGLISTATRFSDNTPWRGELQSVRGGQQSPPHVLR